MPQAADPLPLRDAYGRTAAVARWLLLALLGGHLLLRRAFAHRNLGELLGPDAPALARYAFITEFVLALLLVLGAVLLFRRWRVRRGAVSIGEDALQGGFGPAVWLALGFVAYGAIHAGVAFSTAGSDTYLVLRQSALAAYALFFPLTLLFFGGRGEFIRTAAGVAIALGILCAALDTAGVLRPGWGDRTGQYPDEVPYGQMTLPLALLGLSYCIVVSQSWAWRMAAFAALGFVAWRQNARFPQAVVPISMALAVGGLFVISAMIARRGQRRTFRRAGVLLAGCLLAGAIALALRPPGSAQRQEARSWSSQRYVDLLNLYAQEPRIPSDPRLALRSSRDAGRVMNDPEVYRLHAVYHAAGTTSVINNIWRILVWRRMTEDWMNKYPLFGAGVGKAWFYPAMYHSPFHYGDPREGLDPHNSYLNILHRYGLAGFLLFAGILVAVGYTVWRALHRQSSIGDPLLEGLLLFTFYAAAFACFTVSLEGPSYALPFWMALALTYARARQLTTLKSEPD